MCIHNMYKILFNLNLNRTCKIFKLSEIRIDHNLYANFQKERLVNIALFSFCAVKKNTWFLPLIKTLLLFACNQPSKSNKNCTQQWITLDNWKGIIRNWFFFFFNFYLWIVHYIPTYMVSAWDIPFQNILIIQQVIQKF